MNEEQKTGGLEHLVEGQETESVIKEEKPVETESKDKAETEKRDKLERLAEDVYASFVSAVGERMKEMTADLKGQSIKAESVTMSEIVGEVLANSAEKNLSQLAQLNEQEQSQVVELINKRIRADLFRDEPTNLAERPPDVVDANPGQSFLDHIEGRDVSQLAESREEIVESLKRINLNAEYKLSKWGSWDPADTALKTYEALITKGAKVDLRSSGFEHLKGMLGNYLASLQLDLESKPNYRYARPEMPAQIKFIESLVKRMSAVEAKLAEE